tara:strand:+ start:42 stop:455 length:414 start_codon:yes stop_codon:yes gene_type:complete
MGRADVFGDISTWQERSWLSHRMADGVYLLHTGITLYCAFAWLGPHDWMLWGVVIIYGSTEMLWLFRDSFCVLTDLERHLRGVPKPDSYLEQNFIRRLLLSLFHKDIAPDVAKTITRAWGRVGFLVASVRLFVPGVP